MDRRFFLAISFLYFIVFSQTNHRSLFQRRRELKVNLNINICELWEEIELFGENLTWVENVNSTQTDGRLKPGIELPSCWEASVLTTNLLWSPTNQSRCLFCACARSLYALETKTNGAFLKPSRRVQRVFYCLCLDVVTVTLCSCGEKLNNWKRNI